MIPTIEILRSKVTLAADTVVSRFVTVKGALPAAGGNAFGTLFHGGKKGEAVAVAVLGTTAAISGAAIDQGDAVMVTAEGKVVEQTDGNVVVGRALTSVDAADKEIEILLIAN